MAWRETLKHYRQLIDEFLFGATLSWTLVPRLIQRRAEMERVFALILTMYLQGTPVLPAHDMLKLLPYLVPNLMHWRRRTIFDQALDGVDLKQLGH